MQGDEKDERIYIVTDVLPKQTLSHLKAVNYGCFCATGCFGYRMKILEQQQNRQRIKYQSNLIRVSSQ